MDKYSGKTIWTWTIPKGWRYNALLVEGDLVLVCADGYMYGLDAWTGTLRWQNYLRGLLTGPPCIATAAGHTVIGPLAAASEAARSS